LGSDIVDNFEIQGSALELKELIFLPRLLATLMDSGGSKDGLLVSTDTRRWWL
jgi:hypothetical protein